MEKPPFLIGDASSKGPFSIAMLVCQCVFHFINRPFYWRETPFCWGFLWWSSPSIQKDPVCLEQVKCWKKMKDGYRNNGKWCKIWRVSWAQSPCLDLYEAISYLHLGSCTETLQGVQTHLHGSNHMATLCPTPWREDSMISYPLT